MEGTKHKFQGKLQSSFKKEEEEEIQQRLKRTAHNPETNGQDQHVSKVERCLECSIHLCLENEVVDRIEVHINSNRSSGKKTCPLPPIVLGLRNPSGIDGRAKKYFK